MDSLNNTRLTLKYSYKFARASDEDINTAAYSVKEKYNIDDEDYIKLQVCLQISAVRELQRRHK